MKYNFQFTVINFFIQILYSSSYYRFLVTGFMCQMPGLFHKRGTLTPPVLISCPRCMGETYVYSMHRDIMHCCVGYRSGMRTKAMPPACFFMYGISWLWHGNRPSSNNRITRNYHAFTLSGKIL